MADEGQDLPPTGFIRRRPFFQVDAMPVVKTSKIFFGGKPVTMRVTVNGKGMFAAAIPEFANAALGIESVTAKTLNECIRAYTAAKDQFAKLLQSERLVIRYTFRIQDKVNKYTDHEGRDDLTFGIGKGVQFGVANMYETTHLNADGEEFRRSYRFRRVDDAEDIEQPYPKGYQFSKFDSLGEERDGKVKTCEWTPERERWFLSLCIALDGLIGKLRELDESPAKLIESVNRQAALPDFSGAA